MLRAIIYLTTPGNFGCDLHPGKQQGAAHWGPILKKAQQDIYIELRRRKKPFVTLVSETGRVTKVKLYRVNNHEFRTREIPIAKYEEKPRKGKKHIKRGETGFLDFEK